MLPSSEINKHKDKLLMRKSQTPQATVTNCIKILHKQLNTQKKLNTETDTSCFIIYLCYLS